MSKFYDEKLNKILKSASGKGPYPWSHYRDAYCGSGRGRPVPRRLRELFTKRMMEYIEMSPRIILTRPYNISEPPTIEVLANG